MDPKDCLKNVGKVQNREKNREQRTTKRREGNYKNLKYIVNNILWNRRKSYFGLLTFLPTVRGGFQRLS